MLGCGYQDGMFVWCEGKTEVKVSTQDKKLACQGEGLALRKTWVKLKSKAWPTLQLQPRFD